MRVLVAHGIITGLVTERITQVTPVTGCTAYNSCLRSRKRQKLPMCWLVLSYWIRVMKGPWY